MSLWISSPLGQTDLEEGTHHLRLSGYVRVCVPGPDVPEMLAWLSGSSKLGVQSS
jgi:hypothetical protein